MLKVKCFLCKNQGIGKTKHDHLYLVYKNKILGYFHITKENITWYPESIGGTLSDLFKFYENIIEIDLSIISNKIPFSLFDYMEN